MYRASRPSEVRLLHPNWTQLCPGERLTCLSLAFRRLISQVPASLQKAADNLDGLARRHRRGDKGATAQAVSRAASTLGRRMTLAGQSGRSSLRGSRSRLAAASSPGDTGGISDAVMQMRSVRAWESIASSLAVLVSSPANGMLIAC